LTVLSVLISGIIIEQKNTGTDEAGKNSGTDADDSANGEGDDYTEGDDHTGPVPDPDFELEGIDKKKVSL
jgi:hypothetical protein